ncbi:MAG: glycosyltransferase [Myxococcales bacterium]|nr:glycosyltransferase [Myxococcales bacterium]
MTVDVVVPVYKHLEFTMQCLRSVLEHGGPALGRLIIINDASPEKELMRHLEGLRRDDGRVRLLVNRVNKGFVHTANLGLSLGEDDVVLLNSDARLTKGALDELLGCLHCDVFAAVSPLSNNATLCSVPTFQEASPVKMLEGVPLELGGIPRATVMPTLNGFCIAFRRKALATLGLFDPKFSPGYHEENDWSQRARAAGWKVARANRAVVLHHGGASFHAARARLDVVHGRRLVARYPNYLDETEQFARSPLSGVAARAVRFSMNRLRVRLPVSTMDELERARFLGNTMVAEAVTETMGEACHWAQVPLAAKIAPDVTVVRGVGRWPATSVLVTLIDHTTPLDEVGLPAQLALSQGIVTNSEGLATRIRLELAQPPHRVTVATKDDHLPFLQLLRKVALSPDAEILERATRYALEHPDRPDDDLKADASAA